MKIKEKYGGITSPFVILLIVAILIIIAGGLILKIGEDKPENVNETARKQTSAEANTEPNANLSQPTPVQPPLINNESKEDGVPAPPNLLMQQTPQPVNITPALIILSSSWSPNTLMPHIFTAHHNGMFGDWLPDYKSIATLRVNKSGTWSEIFSSRALNSNDVIHIPKNIIVTYNLPSNTPFKAIVIEGTLLFSPSKTTNFTVGTIVVENTGTLEIIPDNEMVQTKILFSGKLNKNEDPAQLSIGLFSNGGTVNVIGTTRQPAMAIASNAPAGAQSIVVNDASGWKTDDLVFFPDQQENTNPSYWNFQNTYAPQTERKKIISIQGNTITLDSPLQYKHTLPDMQAYLGMVTRNVIFASDIASGSDRAHIMFTGHTYVTFKNALMIDMGRTTVAVRDDTKWDANGYPTHIGSNQRGRYVLHAHHVQEPVLFEGNAVMGLATPAGSDRQGLVIHDSRGAVRNNIVVGVRGSGIFFEDGPETGIIENNLVIGTGGGSGITDDGPRFASLLGEDIGSGGSGIWIRGPLPLIRNNVVTGYLSDSAYIIFTQPDFYRPFIPNIPGTPPDLIGKNLTVVAGLGISQIPIQQYGGFEDNIAQGIFPTGLAIMYRFPQTYDIFKRTTISMLGQFGNAVFVTHGSRIILEDFVLKGAPNAVAISKHNGIFSSVELKGGRIESFSQGIITFPKGNIVESTVFVNNTYDIVVFEGSGNITLYNYPSQGLNYRLYSNNSDVPGTYEILPKIYGYALRLP